MKSLQWLLGAWYVKSKKLILQIQASFGLVWFGFPWQCSSAQLWLSWSSLRRPNCLWTQRFHLFITSKCWDWKYVPSLLARLLFLFVCFVLFFVFTLHFQHNFQLFPYILGGVTSRILSVVVWIGYIPWRFMSVNTSSPVGGASWGDFGNIRRKSHAGGNRSVEMDFESL